MSVVRPLVVMAHGEPRFFCSCGEEMHPYHGKRREHVPLILKGSDSGSVSGVTGYGERLSEFFWYACAGCGNITQEIEVGAVASPEHAA